MGSACRQQALPSLMVRRQPLASATPRYNHPQTRLNPRKRPQVAQSSHLHLGVSKLRPSGTLKLRKRMGSSQMI